MLITEMELFYAEHWIQIVKIKPLLDQKPFWNLTDLLKLFDLHFEAVFSVYYPMKGTSLQGVLQCISSIVSSPCTVSDKLRQVIEGDFFNILVYM